jgi:hypothetical protein
MPIAKERKRDLSRERRFRERETPSLRSEREIAEVWVFFRE